ncbi:hypothetical protein FOZ63_029331 [Perkinsus olseni]|uniref:Uncharacterized protein n=1 Tax=Perkinsus olseni TaxID=32597 RepID=A0A7J6QIM3_PEROL|nr:hypothetical protein FOZ62_027522 [Perkinsus olseni]KAF4719408.1 hypothetical protein FOZ63_029331 [Perkinsus olseni]
MSLSSVQSSLRTTGDQISVDRLSVIIQRDETTEPLSPEAHPDGELDTSNPVPRINNGTPASKQESDEPGQFGYNSSTCLDGAKREVQATPAGVADPSPILPGWQGQRMSEILENVVKFSGAPGEDVEKWLGKLDWISGPEGLNLNYHDQALFLRLSATGDADQTVLMVRPGDPKRDPQQEGYLARLRAQLRNRFANYKAVDDYAAAVTRLVIQGSPKTDVRASCLDDTSTVVDKARLYFDTPSEDLTVGPGRPASR